MRIDRLAIAILAFGGLSPAVLAGANAPAGRFVLQVSHVTFVPGEIVTYTATPAIVVVTYDNDHGVKQRELLRATPTKEQVRNLYAFLKTLPVDSLRPAYSRGDVDDGFEFNFSIQVDDNPKTRVTMNNAWQPDLRKLCFELNLLLPDRLRIKVPQAGIDLPTDIEIEVLDDTASVDNRGPNHRINPAAGGGLAADWRPRSPAAGEAER